MKIIAALAALVACLAVGIAVAYGPPATTYEVDLNTDNHVNSTDQLLVSQHYTPAHAYDPMYDFNADGKVNSTDELIQTKCYGRVPADDHRLCVTTPPTFTPTPVSSVTPTATASPTSGTLPVRVAYVWPRNYQQSAYTFAQGCADVQRVATWEHDFLADAGVDTTFEVRCIVSQYSLYDLAQHGTPPVYNFDDCRDDARPEGYYQNNITLISQELGWYDPDAVKFKQMYIVEGGGGIAGTRGVITNGGVGPNDQNLHYVQIGTWRMVYDINGTPDPCCVHYYNTDFCSQPMERPFTVETFNSWDADGDGNILGLPVMDGTYPPEQQRIDILLNTANSYWRN